ncbi:hypothetical protein KW783_01875, partial [Candidatus Parcubacteria bacterium]|nr:hypothetical protein [Candidatus Parcubacteria bacterium]
GAYEVELTLMKMAHGKPQVAQFKKNDGSIGALRLSDGGSIGGGEQTVMLPDKNAIYSVYWLTDDMTGTLTDCGVIAYIWSKHSKLFEYNASLSKNLGKNLCANIYDHSENNRHSWYTSHIHNM